MEHNGLFIHMATATPAQAQIKSTLNERRLVAVELAARLMLVAVAVGVCYMFQWNWLRALTSELNIRFSAILGFQLQQISFDTIVWRGAEFRYLISATFADVFCGAIPLLWDRREGLIANLLDLVVFGEILIAFNLVRLSFSDVLFASGLPWELAHGVVFVVSYFILWKFIWRRQKWFRPNRKPAGEGWLSRLAF